MMNKYSLLVLLLGWLISGGVKANEPIADREEFVSQYIECIGLNFKDGCFEKIFSGRLDKQELAGEAQSYFVQWVAKNSIYKVHVVDKFAKAGLYERRSYLIERSDGKLLGLIVSFRNVKGSWYAYDIQADYSESFIRVLLGIPQVSLLGK